MSPQEEIELLREENAQLRRLAFGPPMERVAARFKLREYETRLLRVLYARPRVTREQAFNALYWDRIADDDAPDSLNIVSIFMRTLRLRMPSWFDVSNALSTRCYIMSDETRARLKAIEEGVDAAR